MTTLANLEIMASRAVRDPNNGAFTLPEIDDMINYGIAAIGDFFPKEVVDTSITISAGLNSYAMPAAFDKLYRVDIYSSIGTYLQTMEGAIGNTNSGWETHGGVLYLPPLFPVAAGNQLRLYGYGPWAQLTAANAVTDLPVVAFAALMVYVQDEVYDRMQLDRVLFQQWQASPGNNDVSLLQLFRIGANWHSRWDRERNRLRSIRKQG